MPAFAAQPDDLGKELIFRTTTPRNGEPELAKLDDNWITPNSLFYVRSHAPNPQVDVGSFRLQVEGLVNKPLSLSLDELQQRFKQHSAIATMTCAGNRRTEFNKTQQVGGVQWQEGAIGNARWTGTLLSDVLNLAEVQSEASHVWFEGLDAISRGPSTIPFGASIPLGKALEDTPQMPGALLTTKMNDEPLPLDHGYPLRMVVPGYIGARSVKWLGKIVVSNRPSPNHYVAKAYKIISHGDDLELAEAGPLYRFPINSATCEITRVGDALQVSGYSIPDGASGSTITKVELSFDGGSTWLEAQLRGAVRGQCWRLWNARVPASTAASSVLVRAFDSTGHSQPQQFPWNAKGYMYNSWHETRIPS
jgi:sulfite oxidase